MSAGTLIAILYAQLQLKIALCALVSNANTVTNAIPAGTTIALATARYCHSHRGEPGRLSPQTSTRNPLSSTLNPNLNRQNTGGNCQIPADTARYLQIWPQPSQRERKGARALSQTGPHAHTHSLSRARSLSHTTGVRGKRGAGGIAFSIWPLLRCPRAGCRIRG